jgi:predicted lipid-binding transport protein (Tim44 family)
MRRLRIAMIVLSCALMAFGPSLAEAAAGNSRSMGSRGSQTYVPNGARPLERSITPQPTRPPQYIPRPSPALPMGGGFFSQHPFMSGLMGGFIGAGIAGMLFGHSAYAAEASPSGSMLGLLLQLALIGGLIYFAVRLFRRRADPSAAAVGQASYYTAEPVPMVGGAGGGRATGSPVTITDADYASFGDLLTNVQTAWGQGDLAQLRRSVTPEMLSYFSEELSRNASQGLENRVENVRLLKGDLIEAWQEDGLEYATASMHWSAQDYMVRADRGPSDPDYVARGVAAKPVETAEVWTFVRSRGGHWLLSAIQQTN